MAREDQGSIAGGRRNTGPVLKTFMKHDSIHQDAVLTAEVRAAALDLGFSNCGITDARDLDCQPLLEDWVSKGRHGSMGYLARSQAKRCSVETQLDTAKRVLVVTWPYPLKGTASCDWQSKLRGRVAAYALSRDYHFEVTERLERLATVIEELSGARSVAHVDGGPLVEKHLGRRAGLGWYGRNTNLLSKRGGSGFVLGCLITEAALEVDPPFLPDHCGECRACIPACPTGALSSGPTIDAGRCISYLTIEHRGPIDRALRSGLGEWVFGCDLCQDVCPWNELDPTDQERQWPWLPGLLFLTEDEFRHRFQGSPVLRSKRRGLARNAAVVLANTANPEAADWLARALLEHDEALVRAHAAWGLEAFPTAAATAVLQRALRREAVPPVRDAIQRALHA